MNIQNIPRDDKVVKRAFTPKLDAFCFYDYKQIEPRMLAFYLASIGDTRLQDAFRAGKDVYTVIAQGYFGREEITEEERQVVGKRMFLSLMYGGGMPTMSVQFPDMSRAWRESALDQFHTAWPGIRRLQGVIDKQHNARGYIKTLWGRHLRSEQEHKRLNLLIQGGAADLMKHALLKVDRALRAEEMGSHIVNVVHDEIIIDALMNEVPRLMQLIPDLMDYKTISNVVPILVDCEWSIGTWADKETYREDALV